MKIRFTARCGEDSLPLEVDMAYRPGKVMQHARRLAVGKLLAHLEAEAARVDARGEDSVSVQTPQGTWVIEAGASVSEQRGGRF